uniref:Protein artemis n=1 Tax=Timema tahoe TaxID=61484 RepID=A0A7R9FNU4_9NEOP|nr:unnamed protein product [Timema tahoe]
MSSESRSSPKFMSGTRFSGQMVQGVTLMLTDLLKMWRSEFESRFLFEAASCTVLYTGDFRILKGDIKKFKALHSINGKAKTIDTLYLDTTFFTLYGSEYLFRIVANEFDTKVHVSDRVYSFYKCVPEIKDAVTNDPKLSRIHCYDTKELQKMLSGFINKSDDKEIHIKTIKPSALIFKNNIDETMKLFYSDSDIDRVCYSSHSSFSELKDIILHLKPSKIVPCVQPPYMTIEDVKLALRELGVCEVDLSSLSNSDVGEPFSIETKTDDKMIAICKNVCPEFSPLEELLDSPPRKRMA